MTTPSISFTDDVGAATLTARAPTFTNWTPDVDSIADTAFTEADGSPYAWEYRADYVAHLEIHAIPAASLDIAMRLKRWLLLGGTVTINTADLASRTYTAKCRAKKTPELALTDKENLEYTLKLDVRNAAAAPMLAVWS